MRSLSVVAALGKSSANPVRRAAKRRRHARRNTNRHENMLRLYPSNLDRNLCPTLPGAVHFNLGSELAFLRGLVVDEDKFVIQQLERMSTRYQDEATATRAARPPAGD